MRSSARTPRTPRAPFTPAGWPALNALAALATAATMAGCAADPASEPPQTLAGKRIVCTYEAPTGSNIKTKRCYSEEQMVLQQQDARAMGESVQRVRPTSEKR